jgi:hypothetical protein
VHLAVGLDEVTRSTSTARSPFAADFTPSTTPCTTLPAGNGAKLPTVTASETNPDHSWPSVAVSELSAVLTEILSPVPAASVAVGTAGAGLGLGAAGLGATLAGAGAGTGVSAGGVWGWKSDCGCS